MSISSDKWMFYRDRTEWADVTPLPQDDGEFPVVSILYSEQFKDVYDYLRAVIHLNEKSERSLKLTDDAVTLNPANYTVWEYRRQILYHLGSNLKNELLFLDAIIEESPKNYQVWHHRQMIVEKIGSPGDELNFISSMLEKDAKNYHAWQYRQWVLRTFNVFENELNYVEELLKEDIRNNSAWNQRYFVIENTTGFTPEIVEREITFCLVAISIAKKNESPWNYLRGILRHTDENLLKPVVMSFVEDLYNKGCKSPYLLAFMVDALALKVLRSNSDSKDSFEQLQEICMELADKYDVIRKKYWNFILKRLETKYIEKIKKSSDKVETNV